MNGSRATMQSGISQTEKDKYNVISLLCAVSKTNQTKYNESRFINIESK